MILFVLAWVFLPPALPARGKNAPAPAATAYTPDQISAARLALADARVEGMLGQQRAEVLAVLPAGAQLTPASLACALSQCDLVEIYDFDSDTTLSVVVDLRAALVRDVLAQPHVHPRPNQRLTDLAIDIARRSAEFTHELGRVPRADELAPMLSGVPGSACVRGHLCLALTAPQGQSLVWAVVDVTEAKLVAVLRTPTPASAGNRPSLAPAAPGSSGCPGSGSVTRNGWSVSYETTPSDSFRVYNANYRGLPVLTSAKIVEWHVNYGGTGFVDEPGCFSYIAPHGETVVSDLMDGPHVIGFELVQDFRMSDWGALCNYRYEQHDQFYADGRFRIAGKSFGQGCASNGIYRPVMRLDLGLAEANGDSFDVWHGGGWENQAVEGWWAQSGPYGPQGAEWRLTDQGGQAYLIVPGQGQFGDGGRGDFAYLYATQYDAAEGDTDLGAIGFCCSDNEQQGPEQFVNGESIQRQDLVLWYVAQLQTEVADGKNYCWTVSGDPTPETYPCTAGPMFVPVPLAASFVDDAPAPVSATVSFSSTSGGLGPLAYRWDFGDGPGAASAANPGHAYGAPGVYSVTLTITDTGGTQIASRPVAIGEAPTPDFSYSPSSTLSNTIYLTNTTSGSAPMSYVWGFGDGTSSLTVSPSHMYAQPGIYSVVLTATNFISTRSASRLVGVPIFRYFWPMVSK